MSFSAHEKTFEPFPSELASGGNPNKFIAAVDHIVTRDGTNIRPPRTGITVFVGGNNAGKSTFLEDMEIRLTRSNDTVYQTRIVDQLSIHREGEEADIFAWFDHSQAWDGGKYSRGFTPPHGRGRPTTIATIRRFTPNGSPVDGFVGISGHLVHKIDLRERLKVVDPAEQRDDMQKQARNPLHHIQDDPQLLAYIKNLFDRIFQLPLTLDQIGSRCQFRVGTPKIAAPTVDSITQEYIKALYDLPPLNRQGDGMKSLMGLMLELATSPCKIILADEPEAFLHPPQARTLGRVLGELCSDRGIQVFLATHDRNLLVGLLESLVPVTVVRLDRKDQGTAVHVLGHEAVRELWDEPVLRYSNMLDGLFHRAVVLAEADGDCQFYAASLDGATNPPFVTGDILFVPVSGKDAFPRAIKALRSVSVPLVAVGDLDVLNDAKMVKTLVELLGGSWDDTKDDYRLITQQLNSPRSPKTQGQVLDIITALLRHDINKPYDKEMQRTIQAAITADRSPWQDLKDFGIQAVRGGAAEMAADRLLNKLQTIGIVLVREGELERLAPGIEARKGAGWIAEALQKKAHLGEPAQAHAGRIIDAIQLQLAKH